ncbi:MAG: hypothetical protein ABIQ44_02335, partial [Chloroflexia bacterium]
RLKRSESITSLAIQVAVYTDEEMKERKTSTGRGLAGGVLALVVVGVITILGAAGWLWWAGRPVDNLTRLKQLPVYPGATAVVVKDTSTKGEQMAVLTFEVGAKAEDIYAFYDNELKEHGWQHLGRQSDGGSSGYMKRDGSFEGIEFTGGAGPEGRFPWVHIVTNRSPMWLQIDAVADNNGGVGKTGVSIQLMEP